MTKLNPVLASIAFFPGLAQAAVVPALPNAQASPMSMSGRYASISISGTVARQVFRDLGEVPESRGNLGQRVRVGKQITCTQMPSGESRCVFHVRTNHFQSDGDNTGSLSVLRRQDETSRLPSPRYNPYHWNGVVAFSAEALKDSATTPLDRRVYALRLRGLPLGEQTLPLPRNDFNCQIEAEASHTACVIYFDSAGRMGQLSRLMGPN